VRGAPSGGPETVNVASMEIRRKGHGSRRNSEGGGARKKCKNYIHWAHTTEERVCHAGAEFKGKKVGTQGRGEKRKKKPGTVVSCLSSPRKRRGERGTGKKWKKSRAVEKKHTRDKDKGGIYLRWIGGDIEFHPTNGSEAERLAIPSISASGWAGKSGGSGVATGREGTNCPVDKNCLRKLNAEEKRKRPTWGQCSVIG